MFDRAQSRGNRESYNNITFGKIVSSWIFGNEYKYKSAFSFFETLQDMFLMVWSFMATLIHLIKFSDVRPPTQQGCPYIFVGKGFVASRGGKSYKFRFWGGGDQKRRYKPNHTIIHIRWDAFWNEKQNKGWKWSWYEFLGLDIRQSF